MSEPLRAARPDDAPDPVASELARRAREQAEAEAAVADVLRHVERRSAAARQQGRRVVDRVHRLKVLLLLSLVAFNLYAWLGDPQWLRFRLPPQPTYEYYAEGWKVATYLQQQRIENYRAKHGRLPLTAQQAGPVVRGVQYTPKPDLGLYQLAAGQGARRVVVNSSDSAAVALGRTLLELGLPARGGR